MALFGEKYEDVVRTVRVGEISLELCGGCHVPNTGVIGCLKLVSEGALAAGVRRIEAVCGDVAVEAIQARDDQLMAAAHLLSARPDALEERIRALMDENRKLTREVDKWKQAAATGGGADHMSRAVDVNGVKVLALQLDGLDAKGLRAALDQFKDKLGSGVVVLGSAVDDKVALTAGVTKDLTDRISAGEIVKHIAPMVEGSGGGRADMAQAGGKNVAGLPGAMAAAAEVVAKLLK